MLLKVKGGTSSHTGVVGLWHTGLFQLCIMLNTELVEMAGTTLMNEICVYDAWLCICEDRLSCYLLPDQAEDASDVGTHIGLVDLPSVTVRVRQSHIADCTCLLQTDRKSVV